MNLEKELEIARNEIGDEEYQQHLRDIFGIKCLDFVNTIVFNLPEPCYANCEYCIDKELRKNTIDNITFLKVCEQILKEFPNAKEVSITGGTLNSLHFNKLIYLIRKYIPNSKITWNNNGISLNEAYKEGISEITHINLHRNSLNDCINKQIFRTNRDIITIEDAKKLMSNKLCIRVTVDEKFDLKEYASLEIPLYLNRMLPGTKETDSHFEKIMKKLNISREDVRRRNVYVVCDYNGIPVRLGMGDKIAKCVPNRRPTFLNVVIVHRSGIVCGSWYENDKRIFDPSMLELEQDKVFSNTNIKEKKY